MMCYYYFFFFKQKTAYEMRISDWSSDVCSSDLAETGHLRAERRHLGGAEEAGEEEEAVAAVIFTLTARQRALGLLDAAVHNRVQPGQPLRLRLDAGGIRLLPGSRGLHDGLLKCLASHVRLPPPLPAHRRHRGRGIPFRLSVG